MWIFTRVGFFSIVQKRGDALLTVRARFSGDLERLRDAVLPELGETTVTRDADYRYRARVERGPLSTALMSLAADIDYDNFKSIIASRQGHERAHVYGDVWAVLYAAQNRGGSD